MDKRTNIKPRMIDDDDDDDDDDECGAGGGLFGRGNRSTQKEICPGANLSTANPT
jgi:hypothetical protein